MASSSGRKGGQVQKWLDVVARVVMCFAGGDVVARVVMCCEYV